MFTSKSVSELLSVEQSIDECQARLASTERHKENISPSRKEDYARAHAACHAEQTQLEALCSQRRKLIATIGPNLQKIAAAIELAENLRTLIR